jgi:hypothetical protein
MPSWLVVILVILEYWTIFVLASTSTWYHRFDFFAFVGTLHWLLSVLCLLEVQLLRTLDVLLLPVALLCPFRIQRTFDRTFVRVASVSR